MTTLDELIAELLDAYDDDGQVGPGLIRRLDDLDLRTSQPHDGQGHTAYGSRPPASLEPIHWSAKIKAEAIDLDQRLRDSPYTQPWEKALRALPAGADVTDRHSDVVRVVGTWHSTALTVLGLQRPALDMPHVRCLVCGSRSIRCRADRAQPRAWCTNPECRDEDGRPARYVGDRLYLLTTNRVP